MLTNNSVSLNNRALFAFHIQQSPSKLGSTLRRKILEVQCTLYFKCKWFILLSDEYIIFPESISFLLEQNKNIF